jgi:hypothetical protein
MVGSERLAIAQRVQVHKPALLRDRHVEQSRKWALVIRWSRVEGPSLNGQKVLRG